MELYVHLTLQPPLQLLSVFILATLLCHLADAGLILDRLRDRIHSIGHIDITAKETHTSLQKDVEQSNSSQDSSGSRTSDFIGQGGQSNNGFNAFNSGAVHQHADERYMNAQQQAHNSERERFDSTSHSIDIGLFG